MFLVLYLAYKDTGHRCAKEERKAEWLRSQHPQGVGLSSESRKRL